MHTVLVLSKEGNFYRQFRPAACSCAADGRASSERVLVQRQVCADEPLCIEVPGHGTLCLQRSVLGAAQDAVELVYAVTYVHAVEVWRASPADLFRPPRPIALANMCGRLPAQDLRHCVTMAATQKISKCFGRKFCIFTLAGNISFDSGCMHPQFRGVSDCVRFTSLLRTLAITHDGMTMQLLVFCGDLGRTVTVSEQGTLRRLFPHLSGCTQRHGTDNDTNNLRFTRQSETVRECTLCVAVTRHGCVTIRACFRTALEFSHEIVHNMATEAEAIMRAALLVC